MTKLKMSTPYGHSKLEWWGKEDEFVWDGMPNVEMTFNYTHIRYNEETKRYEEVKREVTISPGK